MATGRYTCTDYRAEMTLLGLRLRLKDEGISAEEKARILEQIRKIEEEMGLD